MKVLHLSTFDEKGGAARSAFRLHRGMLAVGMDSRMLVRTKVGHDPCVEAHVNRDSVVSRLYRHVLYRLLRGRLDREAGQVPPGFDVFSVDRTTELIDCGTRADIVNLHWVAGFVDPLTFFRINRKVPIVWRFSDLNPITGGCHYDSGCGKYLTACERCPQRGSMSADDMASEIWHRKKKAFDQIPDGGFHLVAQSEWMAGQMRRSPLVGRFPVTVIANGVDMNVYRPTPRPGLRSSLGIPDDACVVLFVANSTRTRRKGLALLMESLAGLKEKIWLVSVGGNEPSSMGPRHVWLGKVENDTIMSSIYNAADLFAVPSLQDNLPNTAIEALACGTPVVGFNVGGIPDIVEDGVSGLLVPPGDASALATAITRVATDAGLRERMRIACRETAVLKFSLETQVRTFRNLYQQILAAWAKNRRCSLEIGKN